MREQCDVQESTKIHEMRSIKTSLMIRKRMSRDNVEIEMRGMNHILSSNNKEKFKDTGRVLHFILLPFHHNET